MGGAVGSGLGNSMVKFGTALGGKIPSTQPAINMRPAQPMPSSVYQPQYDTAPNTTPAPQPQFEQFQPQYQAPMYMNPYGMYGGFNPYSGGIMSLLGGMGNVGGYGMYGGGFGGYSPYRFY